MKTSTKIWLDDYLVGSFVKLINGLVMLAGKLLGIDHSLHKNFKVLAVCKYKGMGSILQSTPLVRTLRASYPDAKIIYISTKANAAILQHITEIDEVVLLDDGSVLKLLRSIIPFTLKLIRLRIEVLIDLEVYSNFSTLMTILSLAKNRMGFYLNSKHYRMGNYTHMMYYNTRSSIAQTYMQFARLLQCQPLITEMTSLNGPIPDVQLTDTETLRSHKGPYLLINPNASDLRIERQWPKANFTPLIQQLQQRLPAYKIILVGAPSEAAYTEGILNTVTDKKNIYSAAGKTSIAELIDLIKNAALLITNDTGPMHISFATGTQTLALFGPCSPQQYGQHSHATALYANLYCSPCVHEFATPPCQGNNHCMKAIRTEQVLNTALHLLKEDEAPIQFEGDEIVFNVGDFTVGTVWRKGDGE